jgi:hypothetical protein
MYVGLLLYIIKLDMFMVIMYIIVYHDSITNDVKVGLVISLDCMLLLIFI